MLTLRKVEADDCNWLLDLSNETVARSFSYNTNIINYEEHQLWFQQQLENPDSIIFVFEINKEKAGIVKFKNEGDNWLVGINVHKNFRGQSLGQKMLKMAIEKLKPEIPVFAYIKCNNESSIKTFIGAGFQYEKEISIHSIPSYLYIWR
jgi:ribosomal protein S18 acetylase RimI-like enzyme